MHIMHYYISNTKEKQIRFNKLPTLNENSKNQCTEILNKQLN